MNNYFKKYALIFLYSGMAGIVIGAIVFFIRFGLGYVSAFTRDIYTYVRSHLYFLPLLTLGLVILAIICYILIKKKPDIQGGGIARTEGLLKGLMPLSPIKMGIGTILNTVVSYLAGIPLGTEGLIVGTCVGDTISKMDKTKASRRYVMSAGAAAGFAVATKTVLSGISFVLERMHKRFSFLLGLVLASGVCFSFATSYLLGMLFNVNQPFFTFETNYLFALKDIWIFIIVGVVIGLSASLFSFLLKKSNKIITKIFKNKSALKLVFNFLFLGVIGLVVVDSLGNGHALIDKLLNESIEIKILLAIFFSKLVLILISAQSGATGGMFVPALCIGALVGKITSIALISLGVDQSLETTIIFTSMIAFFGTSMNCPITAIIFAFESTLSFMHTFVLIIPLFIALSICLLTKGEAINDVLLSTMLKRQDENKESVFKQFSGVIREGAFVIGSQARDILWPANCLISRMKRENSKDGKETMVKSGDKHFHLGDRIVFSVQSYDIEATQKEILALIGQQELIEVSI